MKQYEFRSISHVFWHKMEDISGFCRWILMKKIILETLLVVLFMIKISPENFTNIIAKFGSKVEICLKSAEYTRNSRIALKFQVICWDIYYFSERLWCQLSSKPHKFRKLSPCKKLVKKRFLKAVGTVPKNGFSQKRLLRFFFKYPFCNVRGNP
jgi:hypothetical protein